MPGNPSETKLKTVVNTAATAEPYFEGRYVVTVLAGPDKGRRFVLDPSDPSRVLVGQSGSCAIRLTDESVSRRHCALEVVPTGIRITDLDSTNGTFVDRTKIIEAELQGGEVVRLGKTTLGIEPEEEAPSPPLPEIDHFGRLWGASRQMRRLYPFCERIAASNVPVVIEGETGTGKEVLAEALHETGPRAAGPFVVFDCTSAPPGLVESELFGHERGAFTGAVASRKGVFEQAQGGTLLIDEIGDLAIDIQPKLLRAVERGEVRRVGGDRWIQVDVRVLSATRRDLDREVAQGRFRDDLFHRMAVTRLELPPLRHRRGDVRLLATRLWESMGGKAADLPPDVLLKWEDYAWPGNVRELRNSVARLLALGDLAAFDSRASTTANPGDATGDDGSVAADPIQAVISAKLPYVQARDRVLAAFEQRYVASVLAAHGGDVAKAAAASGIGRRYFHVLRSRSKSG